MITAPQQNTPAAAASFPFDIKVSAAAEKAAQAPKGSIANAVVKMVNMTAFGTPATR